MASAIDKAGYNQKNFILRHCNELDPLFCDLLVREPIFSLMEAIFGKGFQQCGMNVLRTDQTNAIDRWHCDDALFFPLPDDVPRHDPRIEMPIFWLTISCNGDSPREGGGSRTPSAALHTGALACSRAAGIHRRGETAGRAGRQVV